jgi:exosortase
MAMSRRSLLEWCVFLVLVACYLPTLAEIGHAWSTRRYGSHGFLVPLLGALIWWNRRHRLRDVAGPGSSAGLVVLVVALGLAAVGHATQRIVPHVLSVVLAVSGLALWLRGTTWMRHTAALFPFLLFMLPLPRAFARMVTLHLQHFATSFAAALLDLVHIPVAQAGLVLHLSGGRLRVSEGCNGLGFLMVLLVVTTAFGLLYLPAYHRRLIVIAAAIPAAILANGFRVAVIAAAAHFIGPDAPISVLDDYISKAAWVLALASILGLGIFLCWHSSHGGRHIRARLNGSRPEWQRESVGLEGGGRG